MKTHKYILLFWLLVLAGSFEGWGQDSASLGCYVEEKTMIKHKSEISDNKKDKKNNEKYYGPTIMGVGVNYKFGIYTGEMESVFSDYQAFKPLSIYFLHRRMYLDLGFSFFGSMGKMSETTVLGDSFEGNYYGKYWDYFLSAGYSVIKSKKFACTPLISFNQQFYNVYTQKTRPFYFPSQNSFSKINENSYSITNLGPGIITNIYLFEIADYPIWLSLRYNTFFVISESQFNHAGIVHEFSIGIILIIKTRTILDWYLH